MLVNIIEHFQEGGRWWRIGENPDVPTEVADRWISEGKAARDNDGIRADASFPVENQFIVVVDAADSHNATAALSANQGRALREAHDALVGVVAGLGSGGGGGAAYPEVLNYAALPASPADGSTYVVLTTTGIPFINRKAAGLYRYSSGAWAYLGEVPEGYFTDNVLRFFDNADASKQLAFELGSITSGNVRTLTVPDKSGTIATLSDIVGGSVTVENVLTSTSTVNALSAAQGKALKDTADALASTVAGKASAAHTHTTAAISDFNAAADARISAASVDALADVTVTAPASGQVLKWNGTAWVNADDATGGMGVGANLTYTASATGGVVASDSGTDASLPLADATNAGLMAPDQVTKLAGVASGATANSSDATLLNRANHTGTQLATTIGDLTETVQDIVGALVAAAGGSYDDAAGTITLPAGGGSNPLTVVEHLPSATAWAATVTPASYISRFGFGSNVAITVTVAGVTTPAATIQIQYSNDAGVSVSSGPTTIGTIAANGAQTINIAPAGMPGAQFKVLITGASGTGGTVGINVALS